MSPPNSANVPSVQTLRNYQFALVFMTICLLINAFIAWDNRQDRQHIDDLISRADALSKEVNSKLSVLEQKIQKLETSPNQAESAEFELQQRYKELLKNYKNTLTVTGKVLKVNDAGTLVEVSIGSDDGITKGMLLHVFRPEQYLGIITIHDLDFDRAVGEVNIKLQLGKIREGDNVTTKLN